MAITKCYTIPTEWVQELIEVFGATWPPNIVDESGATIPNPQTKAQYASEQFDAYLFAAVRKKVYEYRCAQATLGLTAEFGIELG